MGNLIATINFRSLACKYDCHFNFKKDFSRNYQLLQIRASPKMQSFPSKFAGAAEGSRRFGMVGDRLSPRGCGRVGLASASSG